MALLGLDGLKVLIQLIKGSLDKKADKDLATTSANGLMSSADKTKLDGVATGANNYTHPSYTAKASGLYKTTIDNTGHVSAATAVAKSDITALGIPSSDTTYSAVTTSANGLMSSTDKAKLDGVATGANNYAHPSYTAKSSGLYKVTVDGTGHVSATTEVAKSDITALGIPDSNTTYGVATTSANGLMSSSDKTKLDGVATGANNYTHPSYTAKTSGLYKVTIDATGHTSAATAVAKADITALGIPSSDTTYSVATTSANGLMSSTDKTKLDGVAAGANNYVHPTTAGNMHIPTGGASGDLLFCGEASGTAQWESPATTINKDPVFTGSLSLGRQEGTDVGENSVAHGYSCIASGLGAHAEGLGTEASGDYSHAEGGRGSSPLIASGEYSHAEGYNTTASGSASHAEGDSTTASGDSSHAEGTSTKVSGNYSHAEGRSTTVSGNYSHAEGTGTTASGASSHAEGYSTTASGESSHAEGFGTTALGTASHAEGYKTTASGNYSHVEGYNTTALVYQHAAGHYNDTSLATAPFSSGTTGTLFVLGNGTSSASSNAMRVTGEGAVIAKAAYQSTGADYAEWQEWIDGNPENEDRRGYFVVFEGDKIRKATSKDKDVVGIISANPCVIGNNDDGWTGKFMMDEFGDYIYEKVEIEREEKDPETGEVITISEMTTTYKVNPDYDPDMKYVHRKDRKEWDCVGFIGMLITRSDGTCQVNKRCKPDDDGRATLSDDENGFLVLDVMDNDLIKVLVGVNVRYW